LSTASIIQHKTYTMVNDNATNVILYLFSLVMLSGRLSVPAPPLVNAPGWCCRIQNRRR